MHADLSKQCGRWVAMDMCLVPEPCACHAVGMEDLNQFSATTPPDSKDPNAPWYHMNVNGTGEQPAAIWGPLHAIAQLRHTHMLKGAPQLSSSLAELARRKAARSHQCSMPHGCLELELDCDASA